MLHTLTPLISSYTSLCGACFQSPAPHWSDPSSLPSASHCCTQHPILPSGILPGLSGSVVINLVIPTSGGHRGG